MSQEIDEWNGRRQTGERQNANIYQLSLLSSVERVNGTFIICIIHKLCVIVILII